MSEELFIAQLKLGNELAFKKLVDDHQDRVYNTCLGMLHDPSDAEDLCQEVFIEVFNSISKFKGESKLSTWMYRIAVTRSIDLIRSRKRKKRFAFLQSLFHPESNEPIHDHADFVHPGVALENKERAKILFMAMDKLPENQRTAFALHKVEGLSYQEVSEVMGNTVSSVQSLMFRARENLKIHLTNYYNTTERNK